MNRQTDTKDIPASVALVSLAALIGVWIYFKAPATATAVFNELDRYAEANLTMMSVVLFATTLNGIWAYSVLSRSFGISRQGQRLEILAKENLRKPRVNTRLPWISFTLAVAATPAFYFLMKYAALTHFPSFIPKRFFAPIWATLAFDIGFSLFVILGTAERGGWFEKLLGKRLQRLPEMPLLKNVVVLGAVEEGGASE